MELLVNQEGKIFGWMSKSDIIYTLRRIGNTIEFWPTRDYPERSEWGQKVTPTQPKSGDYITVSGVTYLMVFTRFSKGSDVSISPVPEDWDPQPVAAGLKWRAAAGGVKLLVNHLGRLLYCVSGNDEFVIREGDGVGIWADGAEFINYAQQWSTRGVNVTGDVFTLSDDGVDYTFTSIMTVAGQNVTITPEPTNY